MPATKRTRKDSDAPEEVPKPPPTRRRGPAFGVGDRVVHPQHGAAVITKKVKQKTIDGSSRDYYVLEIATDQLTVFVPVDSIEEAVRSVISKNQTRKVFQIFKEEPQDAGSNWSRWYKVLNEKMTSGDIYQVAEVIRDFELGAADQGDLAGAEKDALQGSAHADQRAPLRPRGGRGGGDPASRQGAPQGGEGRGELNSLRVGWGFDAHRFGGNPPIVLAGIVVDPDRGLLATSDGDVAAHAVADSLLGAAALEDIGALFPSSDPRWEGADSMLLLSEVVRLISKEGWEVAHVDLTVIAQSVRVAPRRDSMRRSIADVLGLPMDVVSVKATTTDHMGSIGRDEGMAAVAVATLVDAT